MIDMLVMPGTDSRLALDMRTKMSDVGRVSGADFIKRVKRVGKRRGVAVEFVKERGKGSHGTRYFGDRRTTVKHRQAELGTGLLHAMLRQLGLTANDLEE